LRAFVSRLERELTDIETFVTHTDKEAALLENQLIKSHQPKYNVKLRDDKEYLSLRLDAKKPWPRLEVVRRPRPDGAQYFGPYHSATAARQTLRLVNRYFQLRTCTDTEFRLRSRPCLQYQIKRCPGPCVLEVDEEEYGAQVANVARFLDGRHDELVRDLDQRMNHASGDLEYERAAIYRDQLRAVGRAREEQRVAGVQKSDQDVIGFHRQGDQVEVAVLSMRAGRLSGVRTLPLRRVAVPNDEMLGAFLRQHYTERPSLPDEILVPVAIEMSEALEELLSENRKRRVQILQPKRGAKAKLLDLARENAEHAFNEKERAREDVEARLEQLQRQLRLSVLPRRIECVDISHTGGEETVAVFVAMQDGVPAKERYRSFRVKRAGGGDDYAAMYEVLMRRLRRGTSEEEGWELPDLLVVDGGKGQLGVAVRAREDIGATDLEVASVAKPRIFCTVATAPRPRRDPSSIECVAKESRAKETAPKRARRSSRRRPENARKAPAESRVAARRPRGKRGTIDRRRRDQTASASDSGNARRGGPGFAGHRERGRDSDRERLPTGLIENIAAKRTRTARAVNGDPRRGGTPKAAVVVLTAAPQTPRRRERVLDSIPSEPVFFESTR
jgi:excinuclease ABC subunit C